jgi:hypothetical protein
MDLTRIVNTGCGYICMRGLTRIVNTGCGYLCMGGPNKDNAVIHNQNNSYMDMSPTNLL